MSPLIKYLERLDKQNTHILALIILLNKFAKICNGVRWEESTIYLVQGEENENLSGATGDLDELSFIHKIN